MNGTERLWSALPCIGKLLGQGGMASVYEATHVASGQRVALKRVRADARQDPQFIERFLREVRAASPLDHPNICRVLAGGDDGKDVFMAVEILDGGDVEHLLQRAGDKLPAASAAEIVGQLLEALAHAHANGVVHRDIKPQNIMLSGEGVVKLVDFGIARSADDVRLTSTGLVVGTPAYMSPEQARGHAVDARSDLFSVGVVFAEMLTGKNPFACENATATVMKILTETLMPLMAQDPTIPGVLSVVVEGLLQRDPARRYPTARAAADDLAAYRRLVALDHPNLLRRTLDDAVAAVVAQREQQAAFEAERAQDLLALGEAAWPAAALALYRALRLAPENAAVRALRRPVCESGLRLRPDGPKDRRRRSHHRAFATAARALEARGRSAPRCEEPPRHGVVALALPPAATKR